VAPRRRLGRMIAGVRGRGNSAAETALVGSLVVRVEWEGRRREHRNARLPDERARQRAVGRAALEDAGYELVGTRRLADVVLLNTCSVRQHAEDKVYSALGRLKHLKEQKPGTVIGVLGCMAQKDRERTSSAARRTSTWSSARGSSAGFAN
jgi:hypothetical protein